MNPVSQVANESHHWVPKFLIKQFSDEDGRVFCLDVQTGRITKPPPKYAAAKIGFNEFEIDGKLVSFEENLENIETRAAPILKRIVKARSLTSVTEEERVGVANFIAAQSFRTEAFYKGLDHELPRNEFGPVFVELWRSAFLIAQEVANRHWALMVIEGDECFYLGDSPVVLQRTENPKDGLNLGFDVKGVEAFMPLSPKCALYMPCRSISEQIIGGYENAMALHRAVRSAIFQGAAGWRFELELAQRVIRQTHPLYLALTSGTALAALSENVENLNYLQCSWAHGAIYSNSNKFDFAHKVFRENPEYRASPKVELAALGVQTRGPEELSTQRRASKPVRSSK